MNNDFYLCLEKGRQAEVMVANAFRLMEYEVLDVTKNPKYWKEDVDLLIGDRNGNQHKFEVKADGTMGRTKNIVLELTSKTGSKGGFQTTQSTHLVFADMVNRIGYIARTEELREYVNTHNLDHGYLNGCECVFVNINDYEKFNLIALV